MQLGPRRNERLPAQLFTYNEDEIYSLEFGFGIMKSKNYRDMSKPKNFSPNLRLKYSKQKDFRICDFLCMKIAGTQCTEWFHI